MTPSRPLADQGRREKRAQREEGAERRGRREKRAQREEGAEEGSKKAFRAQNCADGGVDRGTMNEFAYLSYLHAP